MFWQAALFGHKGLEMIKKQCQVLSPRCTNFASFNKANCKIHRDKTKNEDFMNSVMKSAAFHEKHHFSKDQLQGIVTLCFLFFKVTFAKAVCDG